MDYTIDDVKKLRAETGAGPADCKSALTQAKTYGEAVAIIEEKGQKRAEKVVAQNRETRQGAVVSYIHHGGNLGVLLELNCSTDFVAHSAPFQKLASELAIQIAAMDPKYISVEDIPEAERTQIGDDDEQLAQVVLLRQPWVKDGKLAIGDMIKDLISKTGENIVLRRFTRYALGE
jgi:elongation factor Ts